MTSTDHASIEFSINWKSSYGSHIDRRYINKIHLWRDILPGNLGDHVDHLNPGENCSEVFDAGILVPPFNDNRIRTFKSKQFENSHGAIVDPTIGKYYPQGWAWRALNCFPQNVTPFRILEQDNELVVADTNHPLSRYPITVKAHLIDKYQPNKERGGQCKDIASLLTEDGPGMQLPYQWVRHEKYPTYPFTRNNNEDDALYYRSARLINHLDETAMKQVTSIYSNILCPGDSILDLMSSWNSHLPHSYKQSKITGLGLNKEELQENSLLGETVVHDLNKNPSLPFAENSFDAVICTSSVEYLTRPLEVFAKVARVIKPGGKFITVFSDRWFPGKEISPWIDLHPFERVGLVTDYYLKAGGFGDIHTESIIGYPRPLDDKHISKTFLSDPIFAVWATVTWP